MRKSVIRAAGGRGVALVLVMVAIGVVVILSLTFGQMQSVSVQLSRNITCQTQARMIAESGLEMAASYVLGDEQESWRTLRTNGLWVQDQPYAGGSFTVYGEDGEDRDGDGVVDGDGDLADESLDLLTLTVVGSYHGATYRARAVVLPPKRVLMIVDDPNNLKPGDEARRDLLISWGWKVRLLDAQATKPQFDLAVANNTHVIYFPAHTKLENNVKDKLKATDLPIVIERKTLAKELKVIDNDGSDYSGKVINVLELTRTFTDDDGVEYTETYRHYITDPFALGQLDICSANAKLLKYDYKVIGADVLAVRVGESNRITLAALGAGALKADKKPARAARVVMPWGKEDSSFSISSLNADGLTLLRRSLDWSGSSWTGLLPGVAAWDKVEIKNGSIVDGFNSALGPYGGDNVNRDATISTNSTRDDKIKVDTTATLYGDIYLTPNANAAKVLDVRGVVTGTTRWLGSPIPVPSPREPTDMGGAMGDRTYSSGTTVIDSDMHVRKLTITGSATVQIDGDVRIFSDEEVHIRQQAQVALLPGATLTMYTKKKVEITDDAQVNVSTADPTRLAWVILKDKIEVKKNAQLYAAVQGYDAELKAMEGGQFYGTFVGKKAKAETGGKWHVDTGNSGTVVTMGHGMDLGKLVGNRIRWKGQP